MRGNKMRKFVISVNGNSYEVEVDEITDGSTAVSRPAAPVRTPQAAPAKAAPAKAAASAEVTVSAGQEVIESPMPGNIWKVLVAEGDIVKVGQTLVILEAMKMENELVSPIDGKVTKVMTTEGAIVNTGDKLVIVE
jgi:biotin carboxyl carrier protein